MNKKDYKDTLLMPKTNFEMRGNLVQKDPLFFKYFEENKLLEKIKRNVKETFILHDGPPYANGDIHLGHSLNKILKDIIVRFELLNNKNIEFIPGWDVHGLPIEIEIQKKGILPSAIGIHGYLEKCREYAVSQVNVQEEGFKKLHLLADFSSKYITFQPNYLEAEIKIFHQMLNQGLIYQDLKPVYWSWSSQSALAEAEIEYLELKDWSVYVKFKLREEDLNLIVWTTTPWTLSANVALALGKDIIYSLIKIAGEKFIIANKLLNKFRQEVKDKVEVISEYDSKNLIGKFAINPLNQESSKIVYGHHVTDEDGTGIVHIAGGHGEDDYLIVKENNLALKVVLDEKGVLINSGEFDKLFYLDANSLIIKKLQEVNSLLVKKEILHAVPVDWRTKKPVVFRATKQWFLAIAKIKDQLITEINRREWIPQWGAERLIKMTSDRSDWCISRQRLWGVPIPIIYDQNGKTIINVELQKKIEKLFLEKGTLGWWEVKIQDLLPKELQYHQAMRKETDILDVWFDSGTSHAVILKDKMADLYFEGTDQYRGWFSSSLITSMVLNQHAPYKKVISHGFVVDENGNKMSKSLGNVITPEDITKKYGVDILRFWVASSNYLVNIRISEQILTTLVNDYKKIRNTLKFILGNLNDYNYDFKGKLSLISESVLNNLGYVQQQILKDFHDYNFSHGLKKLLNELNNGSLAYYLDYIKDIVYIEKIDAPLRREVQYILQESFNFLLFVIAPLIPLTAEEAWMNYKNNKDTLLFTNNLSLLAKVDQNLWNEFNQIRAAVNQELEILRAKKTINRSFEARIILHLPKNYQKWDLPNLNDLLLVAEAERYFDQESDIKVIVEKFDGIKCNRCWKIYQEKEILEGQICKRCSKIIND